MTRKELAEGAVTVLFAAQEELRKAVECNAAGSTGQLEAVHRARDLMDVASNKLVVLEWERTRGVSA